MCAVEYVCVRQFESSREGEVGLFLYFSVFPQEEANEI